MLLCENPIGQLSGSVLFFMLFHGHIVGQQNTRRCMNGMLLWRL